jgi:transcriptional regulator with XRE-family HTH domain
MLTSKKNGRNGDSFSDGSPRYEDEPAGAGGRQRMSRLLRQERERRNLSLREVEQRTRIPLSYLQLLEGTGNERVVPDPMYLIAPLQGYAAFLQVNLGSALTDFIAEVEELPPVEQKVGSGTIQIAIGGMVTATQPEIGIGIGMLMTITAHPGGANVLVS